MVLGTPITGVVLTGGASARMGTDKAFVEVDGRPMAVRVADALWEAGCHPVVCQGGDVDRLAELGLHALPDSEPGAGPVPSILDALGHHGGPLVVAATDLPHLDEPAVTAIIEAAEPLPADAVVAAEADGRRHLVSWWGAATAARLAAIVADGIAAYHVALERMGAVGVAVDPTAMRNVNDPGDLV